MLGLQLLLCKYHALLPSLCGDAQCATLLGVRRCSVCDDAHCAMPGAQPWFKSVLAARPMPSAVCDVDARCATSAVCDDKAPCATTVGADAWCGVDARCRVDARFGVAVLGRGSAAAGSGSAKPRQVKHIRLDLYSYHPDLQPNQILLCMRCISSWLCRPPGRRLTTCIYYPAICGPKGHDSGSAEGGGASFLPPFPPKKHPGRPALPVIVTHKYQQ